MRFATAIAVAGLALGVTACGSTNAAQTVPTVPDGHIPTAAATVTAPGTVTAPHVLSTATATSPATASSTETLSTTSITSPDSGGAGLSTVTTAGTSQCVAGDLAVAAVGPNSAPGTAVLGFTLTNTGSGACHTGGWPGVALYAAGASAPLTTSATRSTSDVLGSTPETEIVLTHGQQASFRLVLSSSGGSGCHTATQARFIAPNDTAPMAVTIPDGAEYCGKATVSPLEPGVTGTGQ